MPLVTSKKMFEHAYNNGYAIGAFNVNNMEIIQGIVEAATEERAPLILQVSKGARAYEKLAREILKNDELRNQKKEEE